jgi:hypothetical protein
MNSIKVYYIKNKILCVTIIILLSLADQNLAQMNHIDYPSEYHVKAAFLYNFAKFIDWPDGTFSDPNTPIIIGVLGEDPFGVDLEKTVEGKRVKGRSFLIKRFHQLGKLEYCHILFISLSEKSNMSQILKKFNKSSILTVSETERFILDGIIINFIIHESKVRFKININAAENAGLKISSKLLRLLNCY